MADCPEKLLYIVSFLLSGILTQRSNMKMQLLERKYLPVVLATTVVAVAVTIAIAIATAVTAQSQLSVYGESGEHRARAMPQHNA